MKPAVECLKAAVERLKPAVECLKALNIGMIFYTAAAGIAAESPEALWGIGYWKRPLLGAEDLERKA